MGFPPGSVIISHVGPIADAPGTWVIMGGAVLLDVDYDTGEATYEMLPYAAYHIEGAPPRLVAYNSRFNAPGYSDFHFSVGEQHLHPWHWSNIVVQRQSKLYLLAWSRPVL
jgi:hypothetical protein